MLMSSSRRAGHYLREYSKWTGRFVCAHGFSVWRCPHENCLHGDCEPDDWCFAAVFLLLIVFDRLTGAFFFFFFWLCATLMSRLALDIILLQRPGVIGISSILTYSLIKITYYKHLITY
jgi:hypothetical protein